MSKSIKFVAGALVVLFVLFAASSCGSPNIHTTAGSPEFSSAENSASDKLLIVTTIFPPYDFARNIGGERVEVKMLLAPGMESHTYEPTPQDIKDIAAADLFVFTGTDNDEWVKRTLDSLPETVATFALMDNVSQLIEDVHSDEDGEEESGHNDVFHSHSHGNDEHVWTSLDNSKALVAALAEKMSDIDAEGASYYKANADAYIRKLDELDSAYGDMVKNSKRKLVVFGDRFPFRYLAAEYDIEFESAFSGCSSETEVSAAKMRQLIRFVEQNELPAVFKIEFSNSGIAEAISEATGAKVLLMHSCHNLTAEEIEAGEDFLSLMKKNLEALREALN